MPQVVHCPARFTWWKTIQPATVIIMTRLSTSMKIMCRRYVWLSGFTSSWRNLLYSPMSRYTFLPYLHPKYVQPPPPKKKTCSCRLSYYRVYYIQKTKLIFIKRSLLYFNIDWEIGKRDWLYNSFCSITTKISTYSEIYNILYTFNIGAWGILIKDSRTM